MYQADGCVSSESGMEISIGFDKSTANVLPLCVIVAFKKIGAFRKDTQSCTLMKGHSCHYELKLRRNKSAAIPSERNFPFLVTTS
jgi:hypothetical protein